jgi:hypothetical protein
MKYLFITLIILATGCSSSRSGPGENKFDPGNGSASVPVDPKSGNTGINERVLEVKDGIITRHKVVVNGNIIVDYTDESLNGLRLQIHTDAQKAFAELDALIDKELGVNRK